VSHRAHLKRMAGVQSGETTDKWGLAELPELVPAAGARLRPALGGARARRSSPTSRAPARQISHMTPAAGEARTQRCSRGRRRSRDLASGVTNSRPTAGGLVCGARAVAQWLVSAVVALQARRKEREAPLHPCC
jgi:hypothetical protein